MPFDDLPFDIIHDIFMHGTEDLETAAHVAPAYSYPLKLTAICKQWTEAALACPALWSTICIHERRGELRPPFDVAERWIQRSGSHPLSFSISSRIDGIPGAADFLQTIFAPHYSRWRNVVVPVPFPLAILPKEVPNAQYPALREITATTHFSSSSTHDPQEWERVGMDQMFGMLSRATGLSTASFWLMTRSHRFADQLLSNLGRPGVPGSTLSNLTLQLTSFNPTMITQILSQFFPNLIYLSFNVYVSRDELLPLQTMPSSNIVRHASLRALNFDSWKSICLCRNVLGQLTLPNLRVLDFEVIPAMDEAQPTLDAIVGFLSRSRCPLEVVNVNSQSLSRDPPNGSTTSISVQILRALPPSIHTLQVKTNIGLLPELLEELTVAGERTLLPRLQTLTLWSTRWDERCYSLTLRMLKSRCNVQPGGGRRRLEKVVFWLTLDAWTMGPGWEAALGVFRQQLQLLGGSLSESRVHTSLGGGTAVVLVWKPNFN